MKTKIKHIEIEMFIWKDDFKFKDNVNNLEK